MAILMGATMAVVMLAFMLGMYPNKGWNVAIFAGAAIVFALALWLVRSQATVSGPSYMRAMIPHHSIAVMTSERAQIRDPRVRKLADEIIAAQRREIAEMRYLVADVSGGRVVESIYRDPPARTGTVADALSNTLISTLDPAPMPRAEADRVLSATPRCTFNRSPETGPILWIAADDTHAAIKLNGILVELKGGGQAHDDGARFSIPGAELAVRTLGDAAGWRANAELIFELDEGLRVGYRGFYRCGTNPAQPG
jgi:hypothetical protein